MKNLTDKQKAFVEEYLICWNATEAARRAGYAERSIRSIASENLTKPNIQAAIKERLKTIEMEADEVLRGLADIARGSIEDFIVIRQSGQVLFDFTDAKARGKLHLIKKIKLKDGLLTEIELYDRQAALVQLGRHHKLFTDQILVDWREEMQQAGLSAGEKFELLVQEIQRELVDIEGFDNEHSTRGE